MNLSRIRGPLACLVAAATLSACSDDTSPTVPGDVVPGRPSLEIVGDFGYVLLPTGRIDVVVGEPVTSDVAADQASDALEHEAPDGGSWIPVHVFHDPFGEMGVPVGVMGVPPQPAQVALVVDGMTIHLGAPYRVAGEQGTADSGLDNVWVAVDQRPDEIESLAVAVTYDGLTQTLDPRTGARGEGLAGPLYVGDPERLEARCPDDAFDAAGVRLDLACAIGPGQRTPYLPGAGWAEEGRSWLVVPAAISIDRVRVEGEWHGVQTIEPTMTVGGSAAMSADGRFGKVRHDPDRASATWAFDAPDRGSVRVELTLDVVLDDGAGTVTVAGAVGLGSAA